MDELIGVQRSVRRIVDADEAIAVLECAVPGLAGVRRGEPAVFDWVAAEDVLGSALPADFKRLCEWYPTFVLDDFMSPGLPWPGEMTGWARRTCKEREGWASDRFHGFCPQEVDAGSLLSWGESMEGDQFLWSSVTEDPEHWLVTVSSRNGVWWHYEGGMVQFLAELCDGTLEPWGLPPVRPEVTGWFDERGALIWVGGHGDVIEEE
ncbi:hypothetical protein [Streptomyces sp. MJM1172]|uniref:hypothetical protein n=1 Tax=Streptomyces sp. MJM1172 TaxID=1703926 RepID=UPI00093B36E8|nr:hypothetical protein [Streptomyces sp. MJM1172]OKI47487.1 hypothetical protein AMK15_35325 [Streptomyces sp. MJM1172]